MTLTAADAQRLQTCLETDGVVLFPTDTVYGLGCDPESRVAVERLYALKGRPPERPAAVMFFGLAQALASLGELRQRERAALRVLLPGPLTVLLPNRGRRFPLACVPPGGDPQGSAFETLGLRVPLLTAELTPLSAVTRPLLQSSANISGESEARRLAEVAPALRAGADLALDGGELPGIASTVVDLRRFEQEGEWRVLRQGPMDSSALEHALAPIAG